jgi:SAM-dependent methyltransferase
MPTLMDVINRKIPPAAWEEGDNIPWDEPAFSERMLREHLRQDHDAASRRSDKIDEQVRWIDGDLLSGQPAKVLDLACGPGLYTSRLARLGHECFGVDFAPPAVAYARDVAQKEGLACTYALQDIRDAPFGDGFGLVMMLSGQFNVFSREEARKILDKASRALMPGGKLLLEPQRFATVKGDDAARTSWYSATYGLFYADPHLCLTESFWDDNAQTSTTRWFIIDAATGEVSRHAMSNEAYTDEQFRHLLADAGFDDVRFLPSLVGVEDESQSHSFAIVARAPIV